MKEVNQHLAILFGAMFSFGITFGLRAFALSGGADLTTTFSVGGIAIGAFVAVYFHLRSKQSNQHLIRADIVVLITALMMSVQVISLVLRSSHWLDAAMKANYIAVLTHVMSLAMVATALYLAARRVQAGTRHTSMAQAASVN